MKTRFLKTISIILLLYAGYPSIAADTIILISKRYLNLPISQKAERKQMAFSINGKKERQFNIRLSENEAEYWVFCDLSSLKGKTVLLSYNGNASAMQKIYQADSIAGQDSLYKEYNRPQFHFTTRRGWINDPNGLIFFDDEYHLFYQHNPYEKEWENMHWGHAVSPDLIHWKELPIALSPDSLGTMFSGSTVMDYNNTAGFNQNNQPAMIAAYTAANNQNQTQCIAYSTDKGRTWEKYKGNPVINSKEKWNSIDTRDPRIFWYDPGKHWVMVLNERNGHSIYNSLDLKKWTFQSHINGFWECPDLFELAVDGNPKQKKWIMLGASNTYMIGNFDGKKFTPETGKHYFTTGSIYAAQTITNMPAADNRRIQIGWGRIAHEGMPFNGLMLIPTTLTLKTTKNGIRLFSLPIKEYNQLFSLNWKKTQLSADKANQLLASFNTNEPFRIKATIHLSHATSAGFSLQSQKILDYDMNNNLINGVFYSPEDMTSMKITADIFIDRTSIEVFIDNGAYSYSTERKKANDNNEALNFWGTNIEIENLEVYNGTSIWK